MPLTPVVIGLDVGTTNAKALAYDATCAGWAAASRELPLIADAPGRAEQDPERVLEASLATLAEAAAAVTARGGRVAGVCLSTAMHGLVGLDAAGRPLTRLITWADQRAAAQARALRASPDSASLARRTGAPLHAMTPLAKLRWFREEAPDTFGRVRRWISPKELLLKRLLGADVVDQSVAGATGLFNLERADWDDEALALAGVAREQLGLPVPSATVLRGLPPELATRLGLDAGTPFVVGASDGALANLGAGAIAPGVAACTVGTSGAVRIAVPKPGGDPAGRLFCYPLAPGRWIAGAAVNDGGVPLRWLRDAVFPDVRDAARARGINPYQALTELAATAPPGAGGLFFVPGLSGERAPQRSPEARGALFGLTLAHGRGHVIRAVMEGVMLQLAGVLRRIEAMGLPISEVRSSGGAARSALWRQIMADAFGRPVSLMETEQASALGAALLGMVSLGLLGSLDEAAALPRVMGQIRPSEDAAASARRLENFERILRTVDPLFEALAAG